MEAASSALFALALLSALPFSLSACSTVKSMLAIEKAPEPAAPIENPFGGYDAASSSQDNIIFRSKKGDRSVEVELPEKTSRMSDVVVPVSPQFQDSAQVDSAADTSYRERKPSISDREITHAFPQALAENESARREIESGLGVVAAEDSAPSSDRSYLAAVDHVKQLFKTTRYEAALLELDDLIRLYPTDPKLYQMRGTLFDRIGRTDLAIKAWNQALRFDPSNESLKRFVDRKQQRRGLASP